jgi:hypothetical protein
VTIYINKYTAYSGRKKIGRNERRKETRYMKGEKKKDNIGMTEEGFTKYSN